MCACGTLPCLVPAIRGRARRLPAYAPTSPPSCPLPLVQFGLYEYFKKTYSDMAGPEAAKKYQVGGELCGGSWGSLNWGSCGSFNWGSWVLLGGPLSWQQLLVCVQAASPGWCLNAGKLTRPPHLIASPAEPDLPGRLRIRRVLRRHCAVPLRGRQGALAMGV